MELFHMEKWLWRLSGLVLLKGFLVGFFLWWSPLDLLPDEAQYWTWSRHLGWGYYSKPPGLAWLIAGFCHLFGDGVLGVRAVGMAAGGALPFAVFNLARGLGLDARTSFWAGVFMAFSPAGFCGSVLATTDGPFILFWTLAMTAFVRGGPLRYEWTGLWVAVGALFKWPIYLLWLLVAAFLVVRPSNWSRRFWIGVGISFLGLLPSLGWNLGHDWATFRHVGGAVAGGGHPPPPNPFEFLSAQVGLLSPLVFWGSGWAILARCSDEKNDAIWFCVLATSCVLGGYGAMAFFRKMQGNWAAFAYPGAAVLASVGLQERIRPWAVGVSITTVILGTALALKAHRTPFYHALGWRHIKGILEEVGFDPERDFLAGEKYQEVSELWFYGPGQVEAVFFNLHGARRNQFCYWERVMRDKGFFVVVDRAEDAALPERGRYFEERLGPYFRQVRFRGWHTLDRRKRLGVFRCEGFLGRLPDDPLVF